ncbi:p-loop containing nucleoside triphosphate hydrolase [Physcia stellaris]|nr:p-loop containing nucleoside triphosphate hydrolase [Physcia stellaris]
MSGAEAILVLGLLASIAGIADSTSKALRRAKDTTGNAYNLPETFELNSILNDCIPKDGAWWPVRQWKSISSVRLDKKVRETIKLIMRYTALLKDALPDLDAVEAQVAEKRSTRYYMVPVQWADQFTGREAELQCLDSKLRRNDKHARVAIAGLGGLGKTRLASQYVRSIKSTDTSVFWVYAGNAERMRSGSRDIAKSVGITGWDHLNVDILKMVQEWFESEASGRWLLVNDNVDDGDLMYIDPRDRLSDYFPRSDRGSILMTTRNRQLGIKFAEATNTITLAALNPAESVALMAAKLGSDEIENRDQWMRLAEKLEGIPLALVQAVSFMQEHEALTLDRYLELYEASDSRKLQLLSENFEDTTRDSDSKNAIATTWVVTFEYMKEHQPLAANLLCLMSMFDTQAIPEVLVLKLTREESDPTLSLERALGVLLAYSLIRSASPRQLRLSERSFDLHRLVRLSTRNWLMMRSELDLWVAEAVDVSSLMYDELKETDYATKSKTKSILLSHTLAVLSAPVLLLDDDNVVIPAVFDGQVVDGDHAQKGHICPFCTANILAEMFDPDRDLTRSLCMVSKAVASSIHIFGQTHPATLQHRSTQAEILWHLERPVEAEIIFVEILANYRTMYGPAHSKTTRTQRCLAETLNDQARYDEAELLLVPLIETCKQEHRPNHLSTLEAMQSLANSLTLQGRGSEAMDINATITKLAPNVNCRYNILSRHLQPVFDHGSIFRV